MSMTASFRQTTRTETETGQSGRRLFPWMAALASASDSAIARSARWFSFRPTSSTWARIRSTAGGTAVRRLPISKRKSFPRWPRGDFALRAGRPAERDCGLAAGLRRAAMGGAHCSADGRCVVGPRLRSALEDARPPDTRGGRVQEIDGIEVVAQDQPAGQPIDGYLLR